ncbi:MAG: amidohydrolase family protein, partial [Caulobacteraceae bacterium]
MADLPADPHSPISADVLISGATLLTMDAERRVISDGALAIRADRIVSVGKREVVERAVSAMRRIAAERFVATPGFVDAHIHITGDPLTRGFARGAPGEGGPEKMMRWVIPIFKSHTAEDEAISAKWAALSLLRQGATTFLEAGTVSHLEAVMEALEETGVRGRVGQWVEGRSGKGAADPLAASKAAIATLEWEVGRWPQKAGSRLAAWPILVGHSTNSDEVWRAAAVLAREHGVGVSAHMSPRASDPAWFLAETGRRPLEHLESIGVMGRHLCLTHLAQIDETELEILVRTGTNAICCPQAALLGGFGLSRRGLFPEMVARGVNVALGSDGLTAPILESGRLLAGLFRDAREDEDLFGAAQILEMTTINGAKALRLDEQIGSLAVGKKADIVLHDADLLQWGPLFDPALQIAFSASAIGVHSVFVDGVQVIEDGRST